MSQDVQISWLGRVKVVRDGRGRVLLIRGLLACAHQVPHIHYYIASDRPDEELERLVDWLDAGFWWDSFLETDVGEVLEKQFLNGRCMGNTHFL
jgi:hypothetical protein